MKTFALLKHALFAAGIAALAGIAPVHAEDYPGKPLHLVVPWPPGGATDAIGRVIAHSLTERLGQMVIVENKPGAGGNIGTEQFVRSAPDGYTLLMATSSTNAANPHLYSRLGFAPKDFAAVAFVASVPNILVVPANSRFKSAKDLLTYAKGKPGALTYGSAGVGSSQHLAGSMLKSSAGIDILHVPYKGSGPAAADLIGGHLDMMLDTGSMSSIRSNKLKPLAIAAKTRLSMLPDVPTFDEIGVRDMYASAWYGVVAPAGTPQPIIARLNKEINQALEDGKVRKMLADIGAEVDPGSPAQFQEFMSKEISRYGEIIKRSGARIE